MNLFGEIQVRTSEELTYKKLKVFLQTEFCRLSVFQGATTDFLEEETGAFIIRLEQENRRWFFQVVLVHYNQFSIAAYSKAASQLLLQELETLTQWFLDNVPQAQLVVSSGEEALEVIDLIDIAQTGTSTQKKEMGIVYLLER